MFIKPKKDDPEPPIVDPPIDDGPDEDEEIVCSFEEQQIADQVCEQLLLSEWLDECTEKITVITHYESQSS